MAELDPASNAKSVALLLARNWWALAIRGGLAILFGLLTFVTPRLTFSVLVILFGTYALLDGVFALISAVRAAQGHRRSAAFIVEGVIGIVAGLVALFLPAVTLRFAVYLVASWAIVTGVLEIAAAFRLRRHLRGELLLALSGVASILFGALSFAAPGLGALAIAWWLATYAVVFGAMVLALAFRLRSLHRGGALAMSQSA